MNKSLDTKIENVVNIQKNECEHKSNMEQYKDLYQIAKKIQPSEAMQLVNDANSIEERKFFVAITNIVLQNRQKEVIERNLF